MSDETKPEETPAPLPPSEAPAVAPAPVSLTPQAPGPRPSVPIDYAMPSQKSFIPSPALIRNVGCLLKLTVGFTVLICMGYFALVALNPKARQWARQGTKPGPGGAPATGRGPTPFKIINQVLAIPAQAMGKTDDVVKANNARVGQLDSVIAEEEGKKKGGKGSRSVADPFASPAAATPDKKDATTTAEATDSGPQAVSAAALLALAEKRAATIAPAPADASAAPTEAKASPSVASAKEGPDQMKLAGDIVIAQASPAGAPRASAAFFYSIVKLNVGGITQGRPARAHQQPPRLRRR